MAEEEKPAEGAKPSRNRRRSKGTGVSAAKPAAPKTAEGLVVANIKDVLKRLKSRPGSKFK